ncbi:MAG: hypothetical protein FD133_472 [Erysipelotrichaceae bacterium]|nr:MAG: hypothetical protein FD179_1606 [Erysipelotrichaceae bacterium]TXT19202.1 MAG: hypothetical protein FD133_472 [Erysipelotrichaceae bacterium]
MSKKVKRYFIKGLKLSITSGLLIGVGSLLINIWMIEQAKDKMFKIDDLGDFDPDCVLVLGAGVWRGNIASPMLQDRLNKAIQISKAGIETTLLMSGDHGQDDYDEVNVMKRYAIDKGLNSSDIFMDHAGFSTYESIVRAKKVFGVKKVIIVSQKEHLPRALYIAKAIGLDAIGVASDPKDYSSQWSSDIREYLARTKEFFYLMISPKPTYLGDPISLDSDGDITND